MMQVALVGAQVKVIIPWSDWGIFMILIGTPWFSITGDTYPARESWENHEKSWENHEKIVFTGRRCSHFEVTRLRVAMAAFESPDGCGIEGVAPWTGRWWWCHIYGISIGFVGENVVCLRYFFVVFVWYCYFFNRICYCMFVVFVWYVFLYFYGIF